MNQYTEAKKRALTNDQIRTVVDAVLDGHSPGSRANVYAASAEEWPVLAEDLALFCRMLLEQLARLSALTLSEEEREALKFARLVMEQGTITCDDAPPEAVAMFGRTLAVLSKIFAATEPKR